jgi:AraC family transcriptional regulator
MSSAAFASAPQGAPPPALLGRIPPFNHPANDGDPAAARLGRLLAEAFDAIDHDRDAARQSLTQAFALLDARPRAAPKAIDLGVLAPWQAKKAIAHIQAHLDAPIRIADLAALARLSRSYFSRAFKATFGCAPQPYILERRIALAQDLMLTTEEPLCGVALACGFSDQAHLSRIFRRLVRNSPHAWRRAHRGTAVSAPATHRFDA